MVGKQLEFDDHEQTITNKCAKRERCVTMMEKVAPWKALLDLDESYYPKASSYGGCPPICWSTCCAYTYCKVVCSSADLEMGDALIEEPRMYRSAGIDMISDRTPDAATIISF